MNGWMKTAGVVGAAAVGLGAWAAHGLPEIILQLYAAAPAKPFLGGEISAAEKYLADFRTGVLYHLVHAVLLAVVATQIAAERGRKTAAGVTAASNARRSRWLNITASALLAGIVLFSGSLYLLVLLKLPLLGAVTPLGGVSLIVGWLCFGLATAASND